ncbi:MAG: FHA domain-containing protein [Bacteroidetes bacterium]|nr:FHA domain-containing protein [Bacteroidota bacterium]
MQGFKKCNNGHFFKEHLGQCPYCKGGDSSDNTATQATEKLSGLSSTQSTQMNFGGTDNFSTDTSGIHQSDSDRTKVFGGGSNFAPSGTPKGNFSAPSGVDDNDRTFIGGVSAPSASGSSAEGAGFSAGSGQAPRASRKMVGWLVSYTIDPMGMDYRLYEGNNPIGRDTTNSIILVKDPTISSKHLNILFRRGKYWAKDEMSVNGSSINGEEMEIGKPYALNDGDLVKVGDTVFKFKSSL